MNITWRGTVAVVVERWTPTPEGNISRYSLEFSKSSREKGYFGKFAVMRMFKNNNRDVIIMAL